MIRVRFAPSPTGEPHLGNIRTALYNWLFARNQAGVFIVRIEDTDRERYVKGATERIFETLQWLGLDWDEGGEKGGDYRPYTQSKKVEIYRQKAQELVKKGAAYYCFCDKERLEKLREKAQAEKQPPKYDRKCSSLSPKEIKEKLDSGVPYVIRLKVPEGETKFTDLVFGEINFKNELIDDQVLLKSDGFPTYFLACVIDDHEMKISHVLRADEWISSTPKLIMLYKAFGWEPPQWVHLPMIMGPDHSKLSKRHGATSVLEYRDQGYLPEAMINFMALLGWNPSGEREIFSKEELVKNFSIKTLNKAAAIFNKEKLDWLNGYYIRQMSLEKLTELCLPYFKKAGLEVVDFFYLQKIVALEQERLVKLSDIADLAEFCFKEELEYSPELLCWKKTTKQETADCLETTLNYLKLLPEDSFQEEILERVVKEMIKEKNFGAGECLWPLRVALTGKQGSPGPFEVAEVLGRKKVIRRIEGAIQKLKT